MSIQLYNHVYFVWGATPILFAPNSALRSLQMFQEQFLTDDYPSWQISAMYANAANIGDILQRL